MAVVWSIWKMRNRILFSNDSFNGSKLVDDAVFLVWSWLSNLDKDFKLPFNLWSSHIREGFLGQASVAPSRSCCRSLVLFCSLSMVPLQTGVVFTGTMSMELSLYFFSTSGTFINILFLLIKKKKKAPYKRKIQKIKDKSRVLSMQRKAYTHSFVTQLMLPLLSSCPFNILPSCLPYYLPRTRCK